MAAEVDPQTITPQNNSHLSEGLLGISNQACPGLVGPGYLLVTGMEFWDTIEIMNFNIGILANLAKPVSSLNPL